MKIKILLCCCILILGQMFLSCSKNEISSSETCNQMVECSFVGLLKDNDVTKTTYNSENHIALWKREDMVGVIAGYEGGSFTDVRMQAFQIENRNEVGGQFLSSATFSGKLTDKGSQDYTYYAIYPYTAFQSVSDATDVAARLEERQYPDLCSWDGSCDMLVSLPVTLTASSVATNSLKLRFTRLFGMLRLRFGKSITDIYGSEVVETISIESQNDEDKLAGKCTIDMTSSDATNPVMSTTAGEFFNSVTLDYRGRNALLSEIEAFFVLNPGLYENVTITVKTREHTLALSRADLNVRRGRVASATLSWKSDDDVTSSASLLPKNPETLKILTFGHSYVDDSMAYMDELLNKAGVNNVTFAFFYYGNCSLKMYWDRVTDPGNTKGGTRTTNYYKTFPNGDVVDTLITKKTVIDGLCDEPWDVIVLTTRLSEEGHYDTFATYLQNMICYIKQTCLEEHGKIPILAWFMYWPYASDADDLVSQYDGSQELNYSAHVQAAKEVMRNNDIQLIIPSGTTIQSLRHSSLNNPPSGDKFREFSRDGYHLDYEAGRYAAACTWYEFFLKPCFGKSVLGNTFIPDWYGGVKVTPENKATIQKAAILACCSPFELSHLDVISPMDITESTESFNLVDNLNW